MKENRVVQLRTGLGFEEGRRFNYKRLRTSLPVIVEHI